MMKLVRIADVARLACVLVFGVSFETALADTKATPAAPAAPAPVSSEPQNTAATYADWTVRCQKVLDTAPRACELEQSLTVQGQQGPIAQISVGRATFKDPLRIVVTLPNNVTFPSSVKLSIDEKDTQPIDLPWLRCLPGGCFATAEFKDDDVKRWKAQTANGRMQFKDGAGRDLTWPFSFKGFAQAMDGLAKTAP